MVKRLALKQLRISLDLTQEEMAERMGVKPVRYQSVECGRRTGNILFWQALQRAFGISDADMWRLLQQQEGGEL